MTNPVRPPGRPRAGDGPAVTGEMICTEALRILGRSGYAGLTLRGLARDLDVSLATIQRHFRTKEDLWRAAVAQTMPPSTEADVDDDPNAAMLAALRARIAEAADRPGITTAVWNDSEPGADERLDHLTELAGPVIAAGRAQLELARELGLSRPIDVDALLAIIGLGVTAMASSPEAMHRLFGIDLADDAQRDRFATSVMDIVLHGVLAPTERDLQ